MSTQFGHGNAPSEVIAARYNDEERAPAKKRKSFQEQVHDFEHEIIAEALKETNGGVTKAAKNLGLTRTRASAT
jgi:transcriptional regulator with PAS, ATPase and Fis domain